MRPGGVRGQAVRPFRGHAEPGVIERLLGPVRGPTRGVVSVHIRHGQVRSGFAAQLLDPVFQTPRADIPVLVDEVGLVQPVPVALKRLPGDVFVERIRLRINFGGIDVHAEGRSIGCAVFEQAVHIGQAAGPLVVVAAEVGIRRIMAFRGVALQERHLAQAVGCRGNPFHIVQGAQERIGGLAGEIERDMRDHPVLHIGAAQGLPLDAPVGDGGILPIYGAVGIGIGSDHHLAPGQLLGLAGTGSPVEPSAGGNAHFDSACGVRDGLPPESAAFRTGIRAVRIIERIGIEGGGQLIRAGQREIRLLGRRIDRSASGDRGDRVTGNRAVHGDHSRGDGCSRFGRGNRDQILVLDLQVIDPVLRGVGDFGD